MQPFCFSESTQYLNQRFDSGTAATFQILEGSEADSSQITQGLLVNILEKAYPFDVFTKHGFKFFAFELLHLAALN